MGHPANISEAEEQQFLALSPWLKDNVQRHNLYYHAPRQGSSGESPDKMVIGMHIDDAIYVRATSATADRESSSTGGTCRGR